MTALSKGNLSFMGTVVSQVYENLDTGERFLCITATMPQFESRAETYWLREGESFSVNDPNGEDPMAAIYMFKREADDG